MTPPTLNAYLTSLCGLDFDGRAVLAHLLRVAMGKDSTKPTPSVVYLVGGRGKTTFRSVLGRLAGDRLILVPSSRPLDMSHLGKRLETATLIDACETDLTPADVAQLQGKTALVELRLPPEVLPEGAAVVFFLPVFEPDPHFDVAAMAEIVCRDL